MIGEKEIEVRTDEKDMLICTAMIKKDGQVELISRSGKKEDSISIDRILSKIYDHKIR